MQLIVDSGGKCHQSEVDKFEMNGSLRSKFAIINNEWSCDWLLFEELIKKESEKRASFTTPDINALCDFFIENQSTKTEAQNFYDFYQSKGWRVGAVKMADWKAAARRWIKANTSKTINNGTDKIGSRNTREGLNAMRDALNGGVK